MSEYREIITKAVVAKGRKFTQSTHTISPSQKPTSILGFFFIAFRPIRIDLNDDLRLADDLC